MNFDSHQPSLAANNPTLTHIAQGAPLIDTLNCLAREIEEGNPGISIAILLRNEDSPHLKLGAAPGLHSDYRCAIDGMLVERRYIADQPGENTAAGNQFWSDFRELAERYDLHVCSTFSIPSAIDHPPGMLVAYSQENEKIDESCRQAIAGAATLAAVALACETAKVRMQKAEAALFRKETIMAMAIEGSGTGVWDRNVVTGQINYSSGWKAILGYADEEISDRIEDSYARVHPDDLAFVQATMQAHFDQQTENYVVEHRIRCKDGSYKWISSRGKVASRDHEGKATRMIGTTTDITAIRLLSGKLQQSVDLITSLTNEVPGLMYQHRLLPNGEAFFSYASEGIREIYELTPQQVAGDLALIHQIIHPDDLTSYRVSLEASAAGLMPWHLEYRVVLPEQGLRWRQGDAQPRRLEDGSIVWHGFITDITDRKRTEIELKEFATIDFLTQLPNRRYFMARMEEELARTRRVAGARTTVLMCDLDHFKKINDSYGHTIGDLALKHFALILRHELRKNDVAGRVGGEEFAVVLSDASITEANIFARRVHEKIANTPLVTDGKTIALTVSIGIAAMHASDASAISSLSRSDMALYRAKKNGRNRIEIHID